MSRVIVASLFILLSVGVARAGQHELLNQALWAVSPTADVEARLHAMCQLESSKKIRKYQPEVKQNMDYLGAHNVVLFTVLTRDGLINDADRWQDSQEWLLWRKFFQNRPDIGTLTASKQFVHLVDRCGLDDATERWKTGTVGTVRGIEYLMKARWLSQRWLSSQGRR